MTDSVNNHIVLKEDYLEQLIEASALLEIAAQIVNHHHEMRLSNETFTGLSILLEKAKSLINVNDNIVS